MPRQNANPTPLSLYKALHFCFCFLPNTLNTTALKDPLESNAELQYREKRVLVSMNATLPHPTSMLNVARVPIHQRRMQP